MAHWPYPHRVAIVATYLLLVPHSDAMAQVGRYYINTPVDTHLFTVTFNGVRSATWADPAIGDDTIQSRNQTVSLTYNYITSIHGRTGGFGVSLPWTSLLSYETDTDQVLVDEQDRGDIVLTFDYNLFGAPALPRERFRQHTPGDYAGLHFALATPTGAYDSDSPVNIGANRWALKSTLNYSITRNDGYSWWDFYPSVRVFTSNSDIAGGGTLRQQPMWGLEAHYSRNVAGSAWLSGGLIASAGGRTSIDGERVEDSRRSLRLAVGGGFPTWPGGAAIVTYQNEVLEDGGASDIQHFMLQLLHKSP